MDWKSLHSYWFGEIAETASYASEREKLWFYKNPSTDEYVQKHFAPLLAEAKSGKLESWKADDQGYLTLIILLDQIPRNSFRNNKKSFLYDGDALSLCLNGLGKRDNKLGVFTQIDPSDFI